MPQPKPIAYPNIVDQIKATVAAHDAIHDSVATHADTHRAKLEADRAKLQAGHMAKKLMEGEGKA